MNKNLLFSQRTQAMRKLRFLSNYYFKLKSKVGDSSVKLELVKQHIQTQLLFLKDKSSKRMLKQAMGAAFAIGGLFVSTGANAQNFLPATSITQVAVSGPLIPDLVDFDNDGDLDVIGISYSSVGTGLAGFFLENTGTPEQMDLITLKLDNPPILVGYGRYSIFLDSADLDNDGDLDIVSMDVDYNNYSSIVLYYENNGDGTYQQPERIVVGTELDAYAALDPNLIDFDEDGDLDLITTGFDISHYLATGEPTLSVFFSENVGDADSLSLSNVKVLNGFDRVPVEDADGGFLTQVEVADFDNDGDLDLLHIVPKDIDDEFDVTYYKNEDGNYVSQGVMSQFNTPGYLLVTSGDVDNDGDVDILYESYAEDLSSVDKSDLYLIINDGISSIDAVLEGEISLIENPITTQLSVNLLGIEAGNYKVSIISQMGQVLLSRQVSLNGIDKLDLELTNLAAGQYFFNISNEAGRKALPFVKQ